MSTLLLVCATSFSALSLGIAVVSLALHWARRDEHPDVAQVRAEITHVRTEIADILDRFEHWTKRERVRRLRAGREEAAQEPAPQAPADPKSALRSRVFGVRQPAANGN